MLIKKSAARKKKNSAVNTVWEYDYPDQNSSFAISQINGRHPQTGRAQNQACDEVYYVLSGTGTIHSDKGDFPIEQGDCYFFKKMELFYVEGQNLHLALFNAPKWNPEQYRIID